MRNLENFEYSKSKNNYINNHVLTFQWFQKRTLCFNSHVSESIPFNLSAILNMRKFTIKILSTPQLRFNLKIPTFDTSKWCNVTCIICIVLAYENASENGKQWHIHTSALLNSNRLVLHIVAHPSSYTKIYNLYCTYSPFKNYVLKKRVYLFECNIMYFWYVYIFFFENASFWRSHSSDRNPNGSKSNFRLRSFPDFPSFTFFATVERRFSYENMGSSAENFRRLFTLVFGKVSRVFFTFGTFRSASGSVNILFSSWSYFLFCFGNTVDAESRVYLLSHAETVK